MTENSKRCDVVGVALTTATLSETTAFIIQNAKARRPACVSSLAVHGVVAAAKDAGFRLKVEQFEILAPDGQPIRWWVNFRYRLNLRTRVSGTDLMAMLCGECEREQIGIYLYGSTPSVVARLGERLGARHPDLMICGCEPSVFRPLSLEEDRLLVARINGSGAGVLLLGLGCPLQEEFAFHHRGTIRAVQVCVGAGFNFLSGDKRRAPLWMQQAGLEWLHRLVQEPRRLMRRYAVTNAIFFGLLCRDLLSRRP